MGEKVKSVEKRLPKNRLRGMIKMMKKARRNISMDQKFFVCEHCGNMIAMVKESGVPIMCVRRHIAGGANGILISVYLPSRLCSPGGDRRLLAEWRHAVVALFEEQESCF